MCNEKLILTRDNCRHWSGVRDDQTHICKLEKKKGLALNIIKEWERKVQRKAKREKVKKNRKIWGGGGTNPAVWKCLQSLSLCPHISQGFLSVFSVVMRKHKLYFLPLNMVRLWVGGPFESLSEEKISICFLKVSSRMEAQQLWPPRRGGSGHGWWSGHQLQTCVVIES